MHSYNWAKQQKVIVSAGGISRCWGTKTSVGENVRLWVIYNYCCLLLWLSQRKQHNKLLPSFWYVLGRMDGLALPNWLPTKSQVILGALYKPRTTPRLHLFLRGYYIFLLQMSIFTAFFKELYQRCSIFIKDRKLIAETECQPFVLGLTIGCTPQLNLQCQPPGTTDPARSTGKMYFLLLVSIFIFYFFIDLRKEKRGREI